MTNGVIRHEREDCAVWLLLRESNEHQLEMHCGVTDRVGSVKFFVGEEDDAQQRALMHVMSGHVCPDCCLVARSLIARNAGLSIKNLC